MDKSFIPNSSRRKPITDWPSLLEQIRERPGMWLGSQSITALRHYLDGIKQAEEIYEIPEGRRLGGFPFDEFEDWIWNGFDEAKMVIRSFGVARRRSDSEAAAFLLWFDWYDQFRREGGSL